jgi:hypothetical protein
LQSVVGGAITGLLTAADSNAAALNEGSKVFSESLSSASSDARDAISGGSDAVHAATTATDMERSHASSSVISTLSKNGSLVQASAKNAGRSLNGVENALATSLTSLGTVSDNMNKASAQSAGSASSLGVSIGSFDSGIADQFNQQSTWRQLGNRGIGRPKRAGITFQSRTRFMTSKQRSGCTFRET